MTESGHAASFGIDIIIMASAGGVELAVGAAAVERHDGVRAEAGVIPQQGAFAYGSCTQPGVQRMLACSEFPTHAVCLSDLRGFCGPVFVGELAGYGSGHGPRRFSGPLRPRAYRRTVTDVCTAISLVGLTEFEPATT
jgi:hypothetical protein